MPWRYAVLTKAVARARNRRRDLIQKVRREVEAAFAETGMADGATLMPLMFGVSFQLPLAMLFLSRINVFKTEQYIAQWKLAVLAIAVFALTHQAISKEDKE